MLNELESCGFITAIPIYGRTVKEKKYKLIDEYSSFYLAWVEKNHYAILRNSDPDLWYKLSTTSSWLSWCGYAFENICFKHIARIKSALGIASVKTTESYWSHKTSNNSNIEGAEIDLIIDRADGCINLCEIKFTHTPFEIKKDYAEILIKKRERFRELTSCKKSLFITFITPFGVKENKYFQDIVSNQVLLEDLF